MSIKKLKGKKVWHPEFGDCIVKKIPKGARSKVEIMVTQRGAGWNDAKEQYEPFIEIQLNPDECPGAKTIHWRLNHRDEYGHIETVNVKELVV